MIQPPAFPYHLDAFAPHISRETVERHCAHHAACVRKINACLLGTSHEGKFLEDLIRERVLFNDACHAWNHDFYWSSMKPGGGGRPRGELAELIRLSFGDFARFKERFTSAALRLGQGWVWVVRRPDGNLDVMTTETASPLGADGLTPILVCDVWEHAYYLDHRTRADYVAAWWELVDWDFAERNLLAKFGAVMAL